MRSVATLFFVFLILGAYGLHTNNAELANCVFVSLGIGVVRGIVKYRTARKLIVSH